MCQILYSDLYNVSLACRMITHSREPSSGLSLFLLFTFSDHGTQGTGEHKGISGKHNRAKDCTEIQLN